MENYPFIKCLHPRLVRNKYTNEMLTVSCGKCEACMQRKSSINVLKCRIESQYHIYSKFVTLTYDNNHIPRMVHLNTGFEQRKNGEIVNLHEQPKFYDIETGEELFEYNNPLQLRKLQAKVEHNDLPILSKRHLQLFIKRLRRYYERYSKKYNVPVGQIRFFACGEYGPVHFRPHYHLILWFSCNEINTSIGQAVSACWKLGRVSTETPRDDVSSYVAKYVNGYSRLPLVYQQSKTRPFSVHSQHLGEQIFQAEKKTIYESPAVEAVKRSCIFSTSYTEFNMWRSLKDYYYPKCASYSLLSSQVRMQTYTIEARLSQWSRQKTVMQTAHYILSYMRGSYDRYNLHLDKYIPFSTDIGLNEDLSLLVQLCDIQPWGLHNEEYYESKLRSVYMVLRKSRHFIQFCCDGNPNKYQPMLSKIEKFYSELELESINNDYKNWQDNSDDWFDTEEEYVFNRTHSPVHIIQSKVYKKFKMETMSKYERSIKHKKQNDLNRVFENK